MPAEPPLPRAFFDRPVLEVAPELLGATVEHRSPAGLVVVRLTEVEAYDGESDPGSHAFRGETPRNAVMFGPAGHVYVYFTYGMHSCANIVCSPEGESGGVLLRAAEIVDGVEIARERRPTSRSDRDLAQGPARLAVALGISLADDGADLEFSRVRLDAAAPLPRTAISSGPRTGVAGPGGSADFPWRFWITGDPTVSPYRAAQRRKPPAIDS